MGKGDGKKIVTLDQYTLHVVDESSCKPKEVVANITLPEWVWGVLQARANFHYKGDLDSAVSEVLVIGLESLGNDTVVNVEEVPEPKSKDWN